jgi:NAD(P)-dependent dehydrogenase (short-subunit alcohol dehydrogenase family)
MLGLRCLFRYAHPRQGRSFLPKAHKQQRAFSTRSPVSSANPPSTLKSLRVSPEVERSRIEASRYFPEFNLQEKVIIVTGGGRGLGLALAGAMYQGGAHVHVLDRLSTPHPDFQTVQAKTDGCLGGTLEYHQGDIRDTASLQSLISDIASRHERMDGLIAAAGVQKQCPALEYQVSDIKEMLDVNYIAVYTSAQEVARQMLKYQTPGSMLLVASMSATIANRGLITSVYNSSKAAVAQLTRNLAMEWGPLGIRVNALCPGHILTPMVQKNFEETPSLEKEWSSNNMLGRISRPEEFRGAATFLLSDASSFMTGASLVIDGGCSAW